MPKLKPEYQRKDGELRLIKAQTIRSHFKLYEPAEKLFLSKQIKQIISALWQAEANITNAAKLLNLHKLTLLRHIAKSPLYQWHLRFIRDAQISEIEDKMYQDALAGDKAAQYFILERKGSWIKKTENNSNESKTIRIEVTKTIVSREERPCIVAESPQKDAPDARLMHDARPLIRNEQSYPQDIQEKGQNANV